MSPSKNPEEETRVSSPGNRATKYPIIDVLPTLNFLASGNGAPVTNEGGCPLLVAFGNPLLDTVATLESESEENDIVQRFGISPGVGQVFDIVGSGLSDAIRGKR